ncbi:MarR family winged helix-turn-helix transcriptional regulator [Nonomuraea basaltis]|uniref:MarR family winged helix-turn-helix transcriptional regulator n=1 Tax=Nonomuraea basaltis TaxID=2495887 RepID=UPI00110C51AB|nr:MarR family winged helix-turn-helix transcriptional regulator [Nonomuraea basaltis]TMR96388.1 winged helix-turn-helix transcriptional regulator [Nonomuraea basaltis]
MNEEPDGGPALFRLVRFWSRRWAGQASEELTGEPRHVQHILVVEAVHTQTGAEDPPTVGTVAHQLGLDHSGASRMVKDAVEAGYLARATSDRDRRRASLELTERGHGLLARSRQWQRQAFDELTASWDPRDRRQFAAHLRRLADEVGA